jgi:transposase
MPKQHQVRLSDAERQHLEDLTRKGTAPARRIRRARRLLLAAAGRPDAAIAQAVGGGGATVENLRRRFADAGLAAALAERPRPGAARTLDGAGEAFPVATACSAPPSGRASWTMQLLAERLVEVGIVTRIADETVRRTLKKRPQTLAAAAVGHSHGERRLRRADGGRARFVRRTA